MYPPSQINFNTHHEFSVTVLMSALFKKASKEVNETNISVLYRTALEVCTSDGTHIIITIDHTHGFC